MGGWFQSSSLAAYAVGREASRAPLRKQHAAYQNDPADPRGQVYTPGKVNSCPRPLELSTAPCSRMLARERGWIPVSTSCP
eukprot:4234280-Alexandrium_andersonii.AAC.1